MKKENIEYTDSHEWVKKEGDVVTVGITKIAVKELGEIVHIELPKIGANLVEGSEAVVLESTKAAIDSCAPKTGEVILVNEKVKTHPEIVHQDPEGEGWLYKIRMN